VPAPGGLRGMAPRLKCSRVPPYPVLDRLGRDRRTHLHGVVAGSAFVVATFLAWALPAAVAGLVRGEVVASSVVPVLVGAALVALGVREARAWRRGEAAREAAA